MNEQNERIKELMDKADLEAPGGKWKEYFAELIVKECLLYTNPSPHENTDFGRGLGWAHQNIKEHSGVEE